MRVSSRRRAHNAAEVLMPDANLLPRIANGRTDLILDVLETTPRQSPLPMADGASLLQWAAYYGDVTALRRVLDRGASLDELGPDRGLVGAAFHGHWRLAQFLLERGVDVHFADPSTGETALHAALTNDDRSSYDPVVEVLLAAGADPCARTTDGAETGSLMRDARTRGEGPLHRAAAFGSAATIQLLLDAGAQREQRDAHGDTALSWASWYRRPGEVLRALLHGDHRIHPQWQPMRVRLIGRPVR